MTPSPPTMAPELLTVAQIARELDTGRTTVNYWITTGVYVQGHPYRMRLPHRITATGYRILRTELNAWLEATKGRIRRGPQRRRRRHRAA